MSSPRKQVSLVSKRPPLRLTRSTSRDQDVVEPAVPDTQAPSTVASVGITVNQPGSSSSSKPVPVSLDPIPEEYAPRSPIYQLPTEQSDDPTPSTSGYRTTTPIPVDMVPGPSGYSGAPQQLAGSSSSYPPPVMSGLLPVTRRRVLDPEPDDGDDGPTSGVLFICTPRRRMPIKFDLHSVHATGVEPYRFEACQWVTQTIIRSSVTEILASPQYVTRAGNIIRIQSHAYEPHTYGAFRNEQIYTDLNFMSIAGRVVLPTLIITDGLSRAEFWSKDDLTEFFTDNVLDMKGAMARFYVRRMFRKVAVRLVTYVNFQLAVSDCTYVFFLLYLHQHISSFANDVLGFNRGHAAPVIVNLNSAANHLIANHLIYKAITSCSSGMRSGPECTLSLIA